MGSSRGHGQWTWMVRLGVQAPLITIFMLPRYKIPKQLVPYRNTVRVLEELQFQAGRRLTRRGLEEASSLIAAGVNHTVIYLLIVQGYIQ